MASFPTDSADFADPACRALALRAAEDSDTGFLRDVFVATRSGEFARSGWDSGRIAALLAGQFAMQHAYYREHYPDAHFDVVMQGDTRIGRLYHAWTDTELQLVDIALMPERRGAGVGTLLMRALVAEAARRGLAARLYVEADNPVRALYGRLGFVRAGENGVYELMRRAPGGLEAGIAPTLSLAQLEAGKQGRRAAPATHG